MNGYMKANILGRDRGIKFGMPAIQKIMIAVSDKQTNIDIPDTAILYEMIYWGLWNNCYLKREVPDFDFESVCNWVDENITNASLFEEIAECFKSSTVIKQTVQEDEKKSHLTSKKKKAGTS